MPLRTSGRAEGKRLSRFAALAEVVREGRTIRARTDAGAGVIPAVISALEEGGVTVSSAILARPSLDDVYLRHAGRTFEAVA